MVYKMFYSNVTGQVYPDLLTAQQAESMYNEEVEKFDEVRSQYLDELSKLRAKYHVQFTTLLENIQNIVDSNSFTPNSTNIPGAVLGQWDVIK